MRLEWSQTHDRRLRSRCPQIFLQSIDIFPFLIVAQRDDIGSGVNDVIYVSFFIAEYGLVHERMMRYMLQPRVLVIARQRSLDASHSAVTGHRNDELCVGFERTGLSKEILVTGMNNIERAKNHDSYHMPKYSFAFLMSAAIEVRATSSSANSMSSRSFSLSSIDTLNP